MQLKYFLRAITVYMSYHMKLIENLELWLLQSRMNEYEPSGKVKGQLSDKNISLSSPVASAVNNTLSVCDSPSSKKCGHSSDRTSNSVRQLN